MYQTDKMLKIAQHMFRDEIVSLGSMHAYTKNPQNTITTVLLGGRIEFNSYEHRRDAMDVMLEYNLYVKEIKEGVNKGRYQAGIHDTGFSVIKDTPTTAVSEMAYIHIKEAV